MGQQCSKLEAFYPRLSTRATILVAAASGMNTQWCVWGHLVAARANQQHPLAAHGCPYWPVVQSTPEYQVIEELLIKQLPVMSLVLGWVNCQQASP